ncbi:phage portal protein [Nonomuraea sp. NPDC023979]|uniref:phage portal protein n=1 Tax=Nonomuraea sp. NPDC023979 TaxID=3154796 RepID=UPI0033E261E6
MEYLQGKLNGQIAANRERNDYYDGNHRLAFAQEKFYEAFGGVFQSRWAENFCALIVDAVAERLRIEGFRMTDDPAADRDAWDIWQRSYMDDDSDSAHVDALIASKSHVLVWADSDGKPVIQPQSANEMYVLTDPSNRRKRLAAYKEYRDDWGTLHSRLWLPGRRFYKAIREEGAKSWAEPVEGPNAFDVVPVVPLLNRPRLSGKPISELDRVIPVQDAINKVVIDALVASEFAAFPQRWVTGMELDEDENGNPVAPFRVALDRMFHSEDPQTAFGQFQAADLSNYVRLAESLTQALASISRIPLHYFLVNSGQPPSGESIKSAEAGLVAKARQRQRSFGESWEEVMRLCFAVMGDPRRDAYRAEVIWSDPEYKSESEHIDALTKLRTLGVPDRQLQEDAGYSPGQIARFDKLMAEQVERARVQALVVGLPPAADRLNGSAGADEREPGEEMPEAA